MATLNKIEDFGAKIGGARKDYAAEAKEYAEKFADAATNEALKGCQSLSALVKLPNIESLAQGGGISADGARAVLTIWRTIERKPTASPWRVGRWAEKTAPKLARISQLLHGAAVTDSEADGAEFRVLKAAEWPAQPFTFGGYTVDYYGNWSYYSEPKKLGLWAASKGKYYVAKETTPEAMAAKLRELVAKDSTRRAEGPALAASRNRARLYYIHPEHNENISIKTMPARATADEVRAYMKEHRAELVERLHALQQFPALRREWNRPRVGTDWRKDRNIMPDDFAQAIPFRGVEFGNWVNQTERVNLLNLAYDGFHDLAQLWGITPDACALGGSLSFAFGSRGRAGAMAHYEPDRKVINLTKKNGAGCMAHEWFHAVDNWVMMREGLAGYATEASSTAASETARAGYALLQAIRKTEFFQRSRNMARFKGDYWTKGRELAARGFEGVCAFLMRVAGVCSDFLVNCVGMDAFTAADFNHRSDCYPYPTEAEAATLAPYYFAFIRAAFGEGVKMSEAVRSEVDALATVANSEAEAAEARRKEDAAKVAAQRAEIEAAAKDHAESLAREERVRMEARTAEIMAECGADWSHVFESCRHYYAVGGGSGFVFLVYRGGRVAYRLLCENNRIKKAFRGAHGLYIEHRRGVDVAAAIRKDLEYGFTGRCLMFDVFRHSAATTWADFRARYAKEWDEVQHVITAAKNQAARGEEVKKEEKKTTTAESSSEAPADGLTLETIAGGVAVVGDSRTTYRNRKQIKAHGARWNKEAQQWQATEQEAVEQLRAWFGMNETGAEQGATAPASADNALLQQVEEITESSEVAKVSENGNGEAAGDGVRYGIFAFSDLDGNEGAPELKKTYNTRAEAMAQMKANKQGRGWLYPDYCQFLSDGGEWWYTYYAKTGMGYHCDFIAAIMPDGSTRALNEIDQLNLAEKLMKAKRYRLTDEYAQKLSTLRPGDVFRVEYDGDAVTVQTDERNAGRYVVAWIFNGDKREQHTDVIQHDAAASVAAFIADSVPAKA